MNPASPEPWAVAAARLPVAFAQVREDPRLDQELCAALPAGATVMMIASGGDTAACLARLPLGKLILVDANAAQLALTRCKLHLAAQATRSEALRFLGHAEFAAAERASQIEQLLRTLELPDDALGPLPVLAARGSDFCGRYEACFAELRATLAGHAEALREFLDGARPGAAAIACDTPLGAAMNEAFGRVMSLPNLVVLFGAEATQNPRLPFACHFASRTRVAAARLAPRENPFLWQVLAGAFPSNLVWDWLSPQVWEQPLQTMPEFHHAPMLEALRAQPPGSVDFLHLSNILDWLAPAEATELLAAAHRALRPRGTAFIRQLNSSLEIPALASGFEWDFAAARAMEERDRSFFYPHLHVGRRP